MVLCSVDYVRSKIFTKLTDLDISDTITETSEEVLASCGTTDETNQTVILAGKNAILAAVLTKMKTTGEAAASVKTGNSQRQNTTDTDIERYEKKADALIEQYKSARYSTFSSPSYHTGFNCHGGHHGFD
jgi:hypothetical protein